MQPPIGQAILDKIGVWTRIGLDLRTANCRADDHGLVITDALISVRPRKRGTITIRPDGQDLFEATFQDLRGSIVESHNGQDLDYLTRLLKRKASLK